MANPTSLGSLQSQVNTIATRVQAAMQQLMSNNPSSQWKNTLQVGGSVSGWFQLTNNGVSTTINNNFGAPGFPQALAAVDISIPNGGVTALGPYNFIQQFYNAATHNYDIAVSINDVAGGGVANFTNQALGGTNVITIDSLVPSIGISDGVNSVTITPTDILVNGLDLITTLSSLQTQINAIVTAITTPHTHGAGSYIDSVTSAPISGTSGATAL